MFSRRQRVREHEDTTLEGGGGGGIPGLLSGWAFRSAQSEASIDPTLGPVSPSASRFADTSTLDATRPSRASSIISTRTGVTIGTLQDDSRSARSIDLMLGGRRFHINRNASHISVLEDAELPPYSPAAPAYSQPVGLNDGIANSPVISPRTISQHLQPISLPGSVTQSPQGAATKNIEADATTHKVLSVRRSPSLDPGPERISVVPKRRSASQGNIPDNANPRRDPANTNPRMRRRKWVRPPRLFTSSLPNRSETNLESGARLNVDATSPDNVVTVQSAGPSFGLHEPQRPHSRNYIGKDATGVFPDVQSSQVSLRGNENSRLPQVPSQSFLSLAIPQGPVEIEEGDVRTHPPPDMDSENDISIHYSRVIRSIDHDYRQALHTRDTELAAMRERLNEMDQVYRQILKDRDFVIDDLQKRLANLEAEMQSRIERAKNEIEDQWEARWRHRDRQLMERMRRMEIESQKQIERTVAQRDEEWVAELQKQNRELLAKLGVEEFRAPLAGT
ncbi:hypothetical protein VTO42DRAFT_3961 [Malbranchea cinnamomea]